jgi:hypothetical protein
LLLILLVCGGFYRLPQRWPPLQQQGLCLLQADTFGLPQHISCVGLVRDQGSCQCADCTWVLL